MCKQETCYGLAPHSEQNHGQCTNNLIENYLTIFALLKRWCYYTPYTESRVYDKSTRYKIVSNKGTGSPAE